MTEKPIRPFYEVLMDPDPDNKEELAVLQKMVDSGDIWSLEGYLGRAAMDLIEMGYLHFPDHVTYDYWGNRLPTRKEWEAMKNAEKAKEEELEHRTLQKPLMKKAKLETSLIQKVKLEPVLESTVAVPVIPKALKSKKMQNEEERLKA